MSALPELVAEALEICGAGNSRALVTMAANEPDERVWRMALELYRRHGPAHTNPLNYFRSLFRTAQKELGTVQAVQARAEQRHPFDYRHGPYAGLVRQ